MKMRYILTTLAMILCGLYAKAQDEPEYRAEIGAGAGLIGYLGDYNGSLTNGIQPMGEVIGRYKFNPRNALRFSVMYGQIKGNANGTGTWYPEDAAGKTSFSSSLVDIGIGYEYNFWPYGTGREYRGAKPFTPYITIGLGATVAGGSGDGAFGMNIPLGVGVKYKLATRLNLGMEWAMHFSTSDELDGVKDPYGIKSSGMFKNTDCYHTLKLSITYDIAPKCKTCNNDRD